MQSWTYDLGDVLLASYKGVEQPVQVAGYVDGLDDSKPLLCHVRVSDGQRWGQRLVKITKEQIIKPLPAWELERQAQWEADLKAHVDEAWAKMSDADKRRVHTFAVAHGLGRDTRSPLDILIDRAVGREP